MQNRSMPCGDVIPELPYPDVRAAADWLCDAFGFRLRLRIDVHRAQLAVGSGSVIIVRGNPREPCRVMVRVADVDLHYLRAGNHVARTPDPPETYPYGERQYVATDLAGHRWVFSQTVADVHPADWGGEWLEAPAEKI
jgi:uncharacterized glyoxalase superfamily protein PhnB